ncbi:predicted protein [Uncinocarpus reesii 1704]|uniref:Sec39 domain-containing protein n=1 Tax=Uncinocarpus reesii (strain UAMH 1704) TaxID=336963 RepID=C4JKA9_UNCRE|nr:uncharacterized protein UREG_02066 [Uncinocarpus reesii 1704]EEP77217.1 predicted protein [Uncinocarpus reesii 1704]
MTALSGLSDAHLVLLAVELCTHGDISQLPDLLRHFRNPPSLDVVLRIILTFLPESVEPDRYTTVINGLYLESSAAATELDIDTSTIAELSPAEARKQVRKLRLLPLRYPGLSNDPTITPLTHFLIHRAYRIDNEFGVQTFVLALIKPFVHTSDYLRNWVIATILPLIRFNYEYHPDMEGALSLELLESLNSKSAVNTLLSRADRRENGGNVDRDIRGLIGPWIYGQGKSKRRKLNGDTVAFRAPDKGCCAGWQDVNEWLLSTAVRDFELAVEAVIRWAGPRDVDLGGYEDTEMAVSTDTEQKLAFAYGQAAIAAVYTVSECNKNTFEGSCRILARIAALLGIEGHSTLLVHGDELLPIAPNTICSNACRRNLLHNLLLDTPNCLTYPSRESITFLDGVLVSIRTLNDFGHFITPRHVAEISLFGDENAQLYELHEVLGILKGNSKQSRNWEYEAAISTYVTPSSPLSSEEVENAVTNAIFMAYDNASNGNRTRGGIKHATEILESFIPHFPSSIAFQQIQSLISATHALSFYSLTLQHGVPFQPVSIRVHQDPLSLIERVLEQNAKAYTELDNLLRIGRDLISAGLPNGLQEDDLPNTDISALSFEQIQLVSAHRVTSLAISCALTANDFDTAYSYITTRLAHNTQFLGSVDSGPIVEDSLSWRAAYNAGRHRPTTSGAENASLQSRISRLSQQMELLSLALVLSPSPDNLPEILAVWRRSDEEMNTLQTKEQEEAEAWDAQGDQTSMSSAPGAFGPSDAELDAIDTQRERARRLRTSRNLQRRHRRDYEEAPMGLFDVARGAARAISKNAFPLASASTPATSSLPRPASATSSRPRQSIEVPGDEWGWHDGSNTPSEAGDGSRVRKRDVVSNMVTGGLVSGLGWVLGAQPVNQNTK